ALVHLNAIWRVDRLIVGVVKLFLIHVEPDEGPLRARDSLLRGDTGRNRRSGGRAYDGPPAHYNSLAVIPAHQSSGVSCAFPRLNFCGALELSRVGMPRFAHPTTLPCFEPIQFCASDRFSRSSLTWCRTWSATITWPSAVGWKAPL